MARALLNLELLLPFAFGAENLRGASVVGFSPVSAVLGTDDGLVHRSAAEVLGTDGLYDCCAAGGGLVHRSAAGLEAFGLYGSPAGLDIDE